MKRYYLGIKYPTAYFTPQEAKCMYYFLQNKTNAEIASLAMISLRTVHYYCANMRCKMSSNTKSDLIKKIRETDFMMHLEEIAASILQSPPEVK